MTIEKRLAAVEQRLAALEARTAAAERITGMFKRGLSEDGLVPYLMLDGRLGIFTEFWSKKPWGQGAAFSVGCGADRFAGYFEIDEQSCPDNPSVAVFASCVPQPQFGQPHIAFLGVAANATENRALSLSFGDTREVVFRAEGMQLLGAFTSFLIGKLQLFKKLWP